MPVDKKISMRDVQQLLYVLDLTYKKTASFLKRLYWWLGIKVSSVSWLRADRSAFPHGTDRRNIYPTYLTLSAGNQ